MFVAGHSHNVAQFLSKRKWWEGKTKTAGKARYVIYCSNKKDNKTSEWTSDKTIDMGVAHIVFEITKYVRPGREKRPEDMGGGEWPVEWILRTVATLGPPFDINLKSGVGQGALHPSDGNCHLQEPFEQVKIWLTMHKVPMS